MQPGPQNRPRAKAFPNVPAPARPDPAFTLIELVVVLALMAILSAMVLPEMRGSFEDTVLRASGRQFMDVFGLANSRAVSLQQTHRVRLDHNAGRYILERQPGRPSGGAAFVPVHDLAGAEGTIDHRIAFELRPPAVDVPANDPLATGTESRNQPGVDAVTFFPDGTADAAQLTLRDRAGFRLALRVNPVTARVKLTEPNLP